MICAVEERRNRVRGRGGLVMVGFAEKVRFEMIGGRQELAKWIHEEELSREGSASAKALRQLEEHTAQRPVWLGRVRRDEELFM